MAVSGTDPTAPTDALAQARAASHRHAWQEAFDAYTTADASSPLGGDDLEAYAEAAFFTANIDLRERTLERAVKAHTDAGDRTRAGAVALGLSIDLGFQGRNSMASAWTQRAARLLESEAPGYAHGYLALARSHQARTSGRLDDALQAAEEAVRIGTESSE